MTNKNFKKIDLVILAGGEGTRIKKLLGKYPKPMIKFNSKHLDFHRPAGWPVCGGPAERPAGQ